MTKNVSFRWLSVAGIEIQTQRSLLCIDPFFTRPSLWKIFVSHALPDQVAVRRYLQPYQTILITHAHYDHLMDVALILELTEAEVYGSENVCHLLDILGVQASRIHGIAPGDRLQLEDCEVEVVSASHPNTPLDRLLNGPLPSRIQSPLRYTDFRMDACYGFRIQVEGCTLLHGDSPVPADVYFAKPLYPQDHMQAMLRKVKPKLVIPIHWDDFFRPFSQPLRPTRQLPRGSSLIPSRLDLDAYQHLVAGVLPSSQTLIPQLLKQSYPKDWGSSASFLVKTGY